MSATADGFAPLAAIEFSLWGEGGPDPDGEIATIPTTTDSAGSASMQYTVDPHAHSQVVITATQTLILAQTTVALNCPDPTPVPPDVTVTFTTYPGEPDYCQAIVTLTGFAPNTSVYLEIRILNGVPLFGDSVLTDSNGAASYTVPFAVSTADDENIEAVVQDFSTSGTASSGVVPISC